MAVYVAKNQDLICTYAIADITTARSGKEQTMKYSDRPNAYINAKDLEIAMVKATTYGDALKALRDAPTIDRPSGAWTPCTKNGLPLTELGRREGQKWYGYKCSECNFIYKGNALIESPFCQNCGCRMKGAGDE